MKKLFAFSAAFAAVFALTSCSKELNTADDTIALPEGKIVSFTLDVPGEGEEAKISFGEKLGTSIPVLWNAGDAFRLFTCLPESEYACSGSTISFVNPEKYSFAPTSVTDCGSFTTSDNAVSKATFVGSIPDDAQSSKEGFAIFPASAPEVKTGHMSSSGGKGLIGFNTKIPAEQDGSGIKYLLATSRLRDGKFQKFTFATALIKINVPSGFGIDKVSLSIPTTAAKPLGGDDVHLYYYFNKDLTKNESMSLSITSNKIYSINLSRGGEELSGDLYFAVRNNDAGLKMTLTFYKGASASKPMTASLKGSLAGGKMLDYGQITPVFPDQTVIEFDREALKKAKQQFVPKNPTDANEVFPYTAKSESISGTSFYHLSNVAGGSSSSFTELNYQWYNEEHTYTCGGYDWVFGSTKEFPSLTNVTEIEEDANKGMYYYTSNGGYYLRMDQGAYLKTPVISGKRLVGIGISIVNSKNSLWWRLSKTAAAETADRLLNDNDIKMNKDSGLLYFNLANTENDKSYYLISNGGLQPSVFKLYYQ